MNSVRRQLFSISLIAALNSGCALIPSSYAKIEPQLEQWEQNHEFGRSLDALGQIDPKDPDYAKAAKQRKLIEKRAAEYEQRVRNETHQKLKQGDWAAALDQYDEALNKHPKSVVIRDGLAKLHQQQRETLDLLERKRLIQHGEWLRDVLPVYREISRVNPRSSEAQSRLKRIIGEARSVAQELTLFGNKALADNDLKSAALTLPLALELDNDPVIEESNKVLRTRLKDASDREHHIRQQEEQQARVLREKREGTIRQLVNRYNQAFAKQDFLAARLQLAEIERTDRHYHQLPALKRSLQKAIDAKVSEQFDAGVSAYSRGQFEQAAREWRAVLKLSPDHQQARDNLERAEKVLEKIERLKRKQGE